MPLEPFPSISSARLYQQKMSPNIAKYRAKAPNHAVENDRANMCFLLPGGGGPEEQFVII